MLKYYNREAAQGNGAESSDITGEMRRVRVRLKAKPAEPLAYPIPPAYDGYEVSEVTRLLDAVERGEPQAADELLPVVYEELRRLAAHKMASEPSGQTLQPTALVHEVWLRLAAQDKQHYEGRDQYFAAAAEMMRRLLVDRARRRWSQKRGGSLRRVELQEVAVSTPDDTLILQVHEVLGQLEAEDPEKANVVRLRFFAGLSNKEAATLLALNERTVRRHWTFAKAWLYQRLQMQ